MVLAGTINMIGSAFTVMFTRGNYLGLPPIVLACLTSTVADILYYTFIALPAMALFAKLIP